MNPLKHAKILVVEDEEQLRRFVRLVLEAEGAQVVEATSVQRALIEAGSRHPELVVLDLGLPDGNGLDFIRQLRAWSAIPVIVLSARSGEGDKVQALDEGADDYLVKPVGAPELRARVRAQLRRWAQRGGAPRPVVEFGAVTVDLVARSVHKAGVAVHLTPIEFQLLSHLLAHAEKVLTHREILRAVWGPHHGEDTHYVRVYLGHLRRKIEDDPARPQYLLTEAGVGYRFRPVPDTAV